MATEIALLADVFAMLLGKALTALLVSPTRYIIARVRVLTCFKAVNTITAPHTATDVSIPKYGWLYFKIRPTTNELIWNVTETTDSDVDIYVKVNKRVFSDLWNSYSIFQRTFACY